MPTQVLKSYAKKTGKRLKEVEDIWEECKVAAGEKLKEGTNEYWAYTNACTRNKLGLNKDKK